MRRILIKKSKKLKGEISVPADKSISHRALIFSALAEGESNIYNLLFAQDCISTMNCLKSLGVEINIGDDFVKVYGRGISGLREPEDILDAGNSGTTMRLLTGVLSGIPGIFSVMTGDSSLRRRPMGRVVEPLLMMGAEIWGRAHSNLPPLAINGAKLKGGKHTLKVTSAQVKSALLLAGILSDGETWITEPAHSRDHTELIFEYLNLPLQKEGLTLKTHGVDGYKAKDFYIPGDFSSAAFIMAGGLIVEGSKIIIKNVGLNPTRIGMLEILKEAGADIKILRNYELGKEPAGDMSVEYSKISSFEVSGDIVPRLIDEIPILAIIATQANGKSVFKNVEELKVKESDRIKGIVNGIVKMGGKAEEIESGFVVYGPTKLKGAEIDTFNDHRIAMAFAIAGLVAEGETILECESIKISFPNFISMLQELGGELVELLS
ncbi:MAG TPA: 3-phosphoshikimate 1-carboxyvinyltransferase [Dictyoglomaceae bacterium]|nr:3-phosphoshikimate 1-carboxyvinyltransferase [Dictyoglomaceae bacterium]HOL38759.1 3-phosphoshikimate 1-carboxyvinyltransferase [Dictyoglomaceae bacterium]HPP15492.1 3-phosphoshikimate 1-carboxyvinyltransferase [Dictyoglomaceae bacterium]HPU43099.1 3-phosphoshikimate 1-carboxyvinyltransferase [Dictyoglomaceae bacterium]